MEIQSALQISFEFYPPKTAEGKVKLIDSALTLSDTGAQFFSVTYGACGTTQMGTLETIDALRANTFIPAVPHLTCVGLSRLQLTELILHYKKMGIKRIVALRGDLAADSTVKGDFAFAYELVQLIREISGSHFHIGVAAYPECHPQSANTLEDVHYFKQKIDAGANSALTQFFFNPDAYFSYRDLCAKKGVFAPIIPGIMPIMQFDRLMHFAKGCGAEIPRWLVKRLAAYSNDVATQQSIGKEVVANLCERLLVGGAPGLHFYTLNHADIAMDIINMLHLQPSHPSLVKIDRVV